MSPRRVTPERTGQDVTVREAWAAMLTADQTALRLGQRWSDAHKFVGGKPMVPGQALDDRYDIALRASERAHAEFDRALIDVTVRENGVDRA